MVGLMKTKGDLTQNRPYRSRFTICQLNLPLSKNHAIQAYGRRGGKFEHIPGLSTKRSGTDMDRLLV
jgi:hypothetical protein